MLWLSWPYLLRSPQLIARVIHIYLCLSYHHVCRNVFIYRDLNVKSHKFLLLWLLLYAYYVL